ncbi:hypothetical protein C0J52_03622, partial [Blattella germanica]
RAVEGLVCIFPPLSRWTTVLCYVKHLRKLAVINKLTHESTCQIEFRSLQTWGSVRPPDVN